MLRKIDACYFLSDTKISSCDYQDTKIIYVYKVNPFVLDLRIVKHLIVKQELNPIETAKFLNHILICKEIVKHGYSRSIVSDFIFDTDVISKVSGLDFVFNKFNILYGKDKLFCYLISLDQAKTILSSLPLRYSDSEDYFYSLIDSIFYLRNNFELNIQEINSPAKDTWSCVFD